eukprot:6513489-Pyramimonas_sp.AAC.1
MRQSSIRLWSRCAARAGAGVDAAAAAATVALRIWVLVRCAHARIHSAPISGCGCVAHAGALRMRSKRLR